MPSNPQPITAYVLSFNEGAQIREVFESIKWADELILVDSFSTDGTVEIAREYGAKIISAKFEGFGKLRNLAIDAASHDWILSIDSDERCTPELAAEVRRVTAAPQCQAYHVPRKNYFLGRWIRGCGWYPDYRQPQLFHRAHLRYRDELVHESYDLRGQLGHLREHALQYPWPTISAALRKMERYSTLMAQRYATETRRAHPLRLFTSPIGMFIKMYFLKAGFRDGIPGLILCGIYSYYTFIKYAKLWEQKRP